MEMTQQADGPPVARSSDHIRLRKQVVALNHMLCDMQRRLFVLEAAAADARADLLEAREVDQQLAEAVEQLLEDVAEDR